MLGREMTVAQLGGSAVVGVSTGLVVLAVEHLVEDVLHEIDEAPLWVPAAAVVLGALVTAALVHFVAGGSSASTEVYVEEFHEEEATLNPRHAPGRLVAAFTTLGSGAPLGMEGPAVYTGSAVATILRRRVPALGVGAHNTLLVAAAAAGIAAVFKAPAAGAIFALEVPFRGRLAGERVLAAVIGSATGFMTMAALDGVKNELEVPLVELTYSRAALAVVLGMVVGVAAIGVIWLIEQAERLTTRGSPGIRALVAGGALAGLYAIGRGIAGESLALQSGNKVIDWAVGGDHALWLLIAVFGLRAVGPAVSIAGGGVGGLFIPLMAAGAVVGRLFADAASSDDLALYVTIGAAAMLGAGYAVPLTAVVFVAEYTGQATLIIPGLLAVAVARLVAGDRSVSAAQLR
ncbi:MAG: chloride channel protein [Acidimicrobiales bacterium]